MRKVIGWLAASAIGASIGAWAARSFDAASTSPIAPERPSPAIPAPTSPGPLARIDRDAQDRNLAQAEAELARLRGEFEEAGKRRDIEFGRLESGALTALEETIAKNESRERELAGELARTTDRAEHAESQIELLNGRIEALVRSLAERDARLAQLNIKLAEGQ